MPKKKKETKVAPKQSKDDMQINVIDYFKKDKTIKPQDVFDGYKTPSKSKKKTKKKNTY